MIIITKIYKVIVMEFIPLFFIRAMYVLGCTEPLENGSKDFEAI